MGVDTVVFFDLGCGGNFFCGLLTQTFYGGEPAYENDLHEYFHRDKRFVLPQHYFTMFGDDSVDEQFKLPAKQRQQIVDTTIKKFSKKKVIVIENRIDYAYTFMLNLYKNKKKNISTDDYYHYKNKSQFRKDTALTYTSLYNKFKKQNVNVLKVNYQKMFIDVLDDEIIKLFDFYKCEDHNKFKEFRTEIIRYSNQQKQIMLNYGIKWRM